MKKKPQLSAGDYVSLLYATSRAAGTLGWASLTGWTRGDDCPKSYKRHVIYSTGRTVFPLLSVKMMQATVETTVECYKTFAKKNKFEPQVVELEEGAFGCLMGPKTAKKTLLWFHGGGYALAAADAHYVLLWALIKLAEKNGQELRAMVLEYELAPHGSYPLQLKQAVAAVKYLLSSGLQQSQILIGGDSAGGNLTAALLGHLSHPNPDVPAISLSENLGGALLVSPWVTFSQDAAAFKRNYKKDALDPASLKVWSDNFMANAPKDNYNTPADAPAEWWKGVKVDHIGVVGGENEILIDDIRTMTERMKVNNPSLEYLEAPDEAHDASVMDRAFGISDELASEQFINAWIMARLN